MTDDTATPVPDWKDAATQGDEQFQVDRAYEGIRRRILDGSFRPGEHLREAQLAEMNSTSRTPVRTALKRLSTEGLVTIGENRRSYVAGFSVHCGADPSGSGGTSTPATGKVPSSSCRQCATSPAGA